MRPLATPTQSPDQVSRWLSRRGFLEWGLGSGLGLGLGAYLRGASRASTRASPPGPAPLKGCILVFQYGGPSHLETWDPKPDAPAEIRGEFRSIATTVPGMRIGEHLPKMARLAHRFALIRSMHHSARLHDSASIHALTGRPLEGPDRELFAPLPQVFPSYGSAVAALGFPHKRVPFAALPFAFHNVVPTPCQGGGVLGAVWNPLLIEVNPDQKHYSLDLGCSESEINAERRANRKTLLARMPQITGEKEQKLYQKAFDLLSGSEVRQALDLDREPLSLRERYGWSPGVDPSGSAAALGFARNMRGQNLLLARRLLEAGVPFVNVHDFKQQGQNWDAHADGFRQHRDHLLPIADQSISALIEDLEARGLLDSTLVVVTGEFGRTPKVNASAGRDHWPDCYSVLLAGGGIRGGTIWGSSDKQGAYPASQPVTPGDLAATIFWRFGIDPHTEILDGVGRPFPLASGQPITRLFG